MGAQGIGRNQVPTKGLYLSAVSDSISPEYSPACQNVRFRFGNIERAPGRSTVLFTGSQTLLDFARHTDFSSISTVLSLHANTLNDNHYLLYNEVGQDLEPGGAIPVNSLFDTRFSWTQGEERLFVVRASSVVAIRKSASQVWSTETLLSPVGLYLEYFKNRVFLMNILQGSPDLQPYANRLWWSQRGTYSNWDIATGGGFLDLYDGTSEPLCGGKVLNDRLVVYRQSSITDMVPTGDDVNPFLPEVRVNGIGCNAPFTLASVGQFHFFVSNDYNVYMWDGTRLTAVGTPIHSYLRRIFEAGTSGKLTPFAKTFMGFKEYWLVFPRVASENNASVVLIYDYLRDSWTKDVHTNLYALYEHVQPLKTSTPGAITTGYPSNYPTMLASRDKDLYIIDERILGDRLSRPADGGMEMYFDTPDMYYDQNAMTNATLERVMVSQSMPQQATDPKYNVEVSTDRGLNFPTMVPVTPVQTHWGWEFADFNVSSQVRRYRFRYPVTVGNAQPSWRSYSDIYVPSGEFFPVDRPIGS